MKRKLDDNDAPTVEIPKEPPVDVPSFESFGLDPRLLQAVSKANFATPTPVQAQTIPLALEGKDVLAQSSTGSGKTAAYVLPTIQGVLSRRALTPSTKTTSALVLVPTRELAEQVHRVFSAFAEFCSKDVRSVNLTQRVSDAVLGAVLSDSPEIVVSTPGRVSQFLISGQLSLENITKLVVDEADLVLSYGYENDMNAISKSLPRGVQTFLMSATLTSDLDTLKATFCKDPVVVKVEDKEEAGDKLSQYVVKCAEDEKFLLIFVIFKLRLVKGKCIIFVADVDRTYRLKLYLEQFGIKSCVLNSELPVNTRLHAVEEFNKGLYDILIAADDQEVIGGVAKKSRPASKPNNDEDDPAAELSSDEEPTQQSKKQKLSQNNDYGVSRGIDFQNVSCVLNFDLPRTSKSYAHRIGRTARAGQSGMALSFVIPSSQYNKHKPTSISSTRHDERTLSKIIARQAKKGREVKDYNFDMAQVDAFRYRMNDALRAVTRVKVQEARAREIKQELIKSEKLRSHFEENPEDLKHLRHDNESGKVRVQGHLKYVPEYLMPKNGRKGVVSTGTDDVGFVGMTKERKDRRMGRKGGGSGSGRSKFIGNASGKRSDPLKSFRRK
jgi:ATP-dependent RNA helicase DDX56/DBP9